MSEDEIYRVVKTIVLSAQLPPGTRLPEARIAPLFGVTRERLRKVLHRLGHEQTLQIVPNIGTVVPTPSLESARELFEARRVLESGICMRLCERVTERELDLLASLMPRRQMLLKRPDLTKVLTLAVDPKSYWIYTNTPLDNDRVAAVFREHGFEAGLSRLAASA